MGGSGCLCCKTVCLDSIGERVGDSGLGVPSQGVSVRCLRRLFVRGETKDARWPTDPLSRRRVQCSGCSLAGSALFVHAVCNRTLCPRRVQSHSLSTPCAIALFVQSTVGGRDKTVPNSVNAATESFSVGNAQIVSSQKLSCPAPCLLYTTTPFLSGRATTIRRGSGSDIQRPTTSPLSIGRGLGVVFLSVVLNSACDFPNRSFPRRSHV
jgi:hypothetical protein